MVNAVAETKADHKTIFAALAAAQMEMGKAIKDTKNEHFRSKYADLASVMDACLGALNRNGICVIQPTGENENGVRFVETILAHSSGETVSCRVPLIVNKNDMQGYGSAVTYARRYGLMSMAGIAPEDDDGNAAAKAAPKEDRGPTEAEIAHDRAITDAMVSIETAENLDSLTAVWKAMPRGVQSEPRVIEAKDKRKAALNPPVEADEIPY